MADTPIQTTFSAVDQLTPVVRQMQAALAALGQQAELDSAFLAHMAAGLTQLQTGLAQSSSSTNQLAAAYVAMAQAIQQQTTAYAQAQAAALAYRQQQDVLRQALQEQRAAQQAANASTSEASQLLRQAFSAAGLSLSIAGLVSLTKSIYEVGIAYANLRGGLTAISGSQAAGAAAFELVRRVSTQTGTDLVTLGRGYVDLSAAAQGTVLSQQQVAAIFELVATRVRSLGGSAEQVKGSLDQFARLVQQPVITFEMLRRLGTVFPGFVEAAARAYQTTGAGLKAMLAEGEQDGAAFATKFGQSLASIGTSGEDPTKRLGSGFNEVKNAFNALEESVANTRLFRNFEAGLAKSLRELKAVIDTGDPFAGFTLGSAGAGVTAAVSSPEASRAGAAKWRAQIVAATAGTNVPPELVEAIMAQESGGAERLTSPKGAKGVMQFMPGTAATIPGFVGHEFDAEASIKAGVVHLTSLMNRFPDDLLKVIAAYNAGAGHGGIPLPGENQDYVNRVAGNLALLRGPGAPLLAPQQGPTGPGVLPGTGAASGAPFGPEALATQDLQRGEENATLFTAALKQGDKALKDLQQSALTLPHVLGSLTGDSTQKLKLLQAEASTLEQSLLKAEKLAQERTHGERPLGPLPETAQAARAAQQERLAAMQHEIEAVQDLAKFSGVVERAEQAQAQAHAAATARLEELRRAYTLTKDARHELTAEEIKAQFPEDAALQTAAATVIELGKLHESYLDAKERVQEFAKSGDLLGLQLSPEVEAARQAQEKYNAEIAKTIAILRTPLDERASAVLRAKAPGGVETSQQTTGLATVDALKLAQNQTKDLDGIYRQAGRSIEQSLTSAFENAFSSGSISARQFGLALVQGLQRTFAQLSTALVNQLLNTATGTSQSGGGWVSALAGIAVKAVGAYFGGGAGVDVGGGAGIDAGPGASFAAQDTGSASTLFNTQAPYHAAGGPVQAETPYLVGEQGPEPFFPAVGGRILSHADAMAALTASGARLTTVAHLALATQGATAAGLGTVRAFAQGGVVPAMPFATLRALAQGGVVQGLGTIQALRLAQGGVVQAPSFGLLGDGAGSPPRQWQDAPTGGSQSPPAPAPPPPAPIHVHLEQSFEGAVDPRALRTSKSEVTHWVIENIATDGALRSIIKQHTR